MTIHLRRRRICRYSRSPRSCTRHAPSYSKTTNATPLPRPHPFGPGSQTAPDRGGRQTARGLGRPIPRALFKPNASLCQGRAPIEIGASLLPVPETRLERLLFVLGVVAIAGLAFWIVRLRSSDPPRHPTATISSSGRTTTTTPRSATSSTGASWIRLTLTARADAPVTVRRGSSAGHLLYQGTLTNGQTRSFAGGRLWVQLGTPGAVSATLDGKELVLPSGAGSVEVTSSGIEAQ